MAGGIFISYRREDSQHAAGRLVDRLERSFGRDQVFMDVDAIEPGLDFVDVLDQKLANCDVLLALIGRGWLEARDQSGRRRLDDPSDFVRLEIEAALRRNIRVIPVLLDGGSFPKEESLPDSLKPLARRQAVRLTHERFASDTEGLVQSLAGIVGPNRRSPASTGARRVPRSATVPARPPFAHRLVAWAYALSAIPARVFLQLIVPHWRALAMAGLGLVSGVLSATVARPYRAWLSPVGNVFFLPVASSGLASHTPEEDFVLIGFFFGVVVAVSLWIWTRNWWTLLALPVATMYAWSAALWTALPLEGGKNPIAWGLSAGAVGAVATHLSCALFAPPLRRPLWIAVTCAVGAVTGTLYFMRVEKMIDEGLLYVIWQPAVAFCIGLGLGREKSASSRLSLVACGYALLALPGFFLYLPLLGMLGAPHLSATLSAILIVALGAYLRRSRGLASARSEVVLYWIGAAVPLAFAWFMALDIHKWSFLGPDRYFASGALVAGIAAMAGLVLMLIDLRRHGRARDAATQGERAAPRFSESASVKG